MVSDVMVSDAWCQTPQNDKTEAISTSKMAFSSRLARSTSVQRGFLCAFGIIGGSLKSEDDRRQSHFALLDSAKKIWMRRVVVVVVVTTTHCDPAAPSKAPASQMSLEPRLKGKVAIITGASRGLGQAIAIKYVEQGCRVILLDVLDCHETLAKIGAIENLNKPLCHAAIYIHCDISNENQVKKAIDLAVQHFDGPKIDILVNNACAFVFKSVEDASVADWQKSMNVNIRGHALVTKYCLPYMKHAANKTPGHGPSIIFQASISSFRAQPNCATYATTKGAIVQLARNCAYDLAKYNIRCNSICAGTIETPISEQERLEHGWSYEEWEKLKTQDVMLGRVGTPVEIANAAVFFGSDESSYCTGSHLHVDGGAAACTVMQR
jgi:NAD(P)-dependent dehydrogenase (short-subunit alcohol dehydrogenase family)